MNKDKMIKWAEALESGQYEQCRYSWGRGRSNESHVPVGFCCLHVALDLEGKTAFEMDRISFIKDTYDITDIDLIAFVYRSYKQKLSFIEIAQEIRKMVSKHDSIYEKLLKILHLNLKHIKWFRKYI